MKVLRWERARYKEMMQVMTTKDGFKDRNIYIEDYLCEIPAEWGREKCIDYACENDYG